jgi:hypothetical protein
VEQLIFLWLQNESCLKASWTLHILACELLIVVVPEEGIEPPTKGL